MAELTDSDVREFSNIHDDIDFCRQHTTPHDGGKCERYYIEILVSMKKNAVYGRPRFVKENGQWVRLSYA